MKINNNLSVTYKGYLQQAWYSDEHTDPDNIHSFLDKFRMAEIPALTNPPLFFIIDYTKQQYLLMTDAIRHIAGYRPQEFIESKLDKMLDVFNKDDFKVYNEHIFTRNTQFLKKTPQEEHQDHIFSYTFRFKRKDKRDACVMQRNSYITSKETNLPLYSLGMVMDLTNLKVGSRMVHTIEKTHTQNDGQYNELVSRSYFYPDVEDGLLTKREKIVLLYLSEGLSSKQVAAKMFLSEHTVIAHKQNMLHKTNCNNVTQLVAFAIRNELI